MKALAVSNAYLQRLAALSAVVIAVSAFCYGVFLLEAVANAGQRASTELRIKRIADTLGGLEGQYFAKAQDITPERAAALGFVAPTRTDSVVVNSAIPSFSFVSGIQ